MICILHSFSQLCTSHLLFHPHYRLDCVHREEDEGEEVEIESVRPVIYEEIQEELVELTHSKISIHQGIYKTDDQEDLPQSGASSILQRP